jgi:hypothetical protein
MGARRNSVGGKNQTNDRKGGIQKGSGTNKAGTGKEGALTAVADVGEVNLDDLAAEGGGDASESKAGKHVKPEMATRRRASLMLAQSLMTETEIAGESCTLMSCTTSATLMVITFSVLSSTVDRTPW